MKKEHTNPAYRLFIKIRDVTSEIKVDEFGNKLIRTIWVEVPEANLGSMNILNKEILGFRFEPIKYEPAEKDERPNNFKGFGNLKGIDIKHLKDFFGDL